MWLQKVFKTDPKQKGVILSLQKYVSKAIKIRAFLWRKSLFLHCLIVFYMGLIVIVWLGRELKHFMSVVNIKKSKLRKNFWKRPRPNIIRIIIDCKNPWWVDPYYWFFSASYKNKKLVHFGSFIKRRISINHKQIMRVL